MVKRSSLSAFSTRYWKSPMACCPLPSVCREPAEQEVGVDPVGVLGDAAPVGGGRLLVHAGDLEHPGLELGAGRVLLQAAHLGQDGLRLVVAAAFQGAHGQLGEVFGSALGIEFHQFAQRLLVMIVVVAHHVDAGLFLQHLDLGASRLLHEVVDDLRRRKPDRRPWCRAARAGALSRLSAVPSASFSSSSMAMSASLPEPRGGGHEAVLDVAAPAR